MIKTEQRSRVIFISIIAAVLIIAALTFTFWQGFSQPKSTDTAENDRPTEVAVSTEDQIVTSTIKGWSISLEVPGTWKTEVQEDSFFNYDTRQSEAGKNTILTHPSGKVKVMVRQMPFFSADGSCGAATIRHLHKEDMPDDRLMYVEAAGEDVLFLSATTKEAAAAITEDFNSCFGYRNLINHEGEGILFTTNETLPYYKKPFVSVTVLPVFNEQEGSSWNYRTFTDFLNTKEYLEAKEIVKTLKI